MKPPYIIDLHVKKNNKPGVLLPLEDHELGITIKRVFYIYGFDDDIKNNIRGGHGHKLATEIIICLSGQVDVYTTNDNDNFNVFNLRNANTALVLPPLNKITMRNFSKDAILLVLCDKNFDNDEIYI